jgi:hypothetical protein
MINHKHLQEAQELRPIPSFPIPISPTIEQQAQQLAKACPSTRQPQIYQNALAILAVNHYLQCLGISTNVLSTEFQIPFKRSFMDVADIILPNLGTIECCPVQPKSSIVRVPAESWQNRLLYIVVELDLEAHQATLLGFLDRLNISQMEQANSELISLSALHDLDELPDYLDAAQPFLINLQQWCSDTYAGFQSGWHSIKELLSPPQLTPINAYRNQDNALLEQRIREFLEPNPLKSAWSNGEEKAISGYKLITLPSTQADEITGQSSPMAQEESFVLILRALPQLEGEFELSLEALPGINQEYLPVNLKIALLDQNCIELLAARTQNQNRHLQLDFIGSIGDNVIVQISIDGFSIEGKIVL